MASLTADNTPNLSTTPAGWTSLLPGKLRAGNASTVFAFYHVVTASDAQRTGWTWTLSSRQVWSGGMARYMGVDVERPIDTSVSVASSSTARTTITVPSITTTTGGTMLIGAVGANAGTFTTTQPAGWTEAWERTSGEASEHAYRPQQDAGATGGQTWTVSSARALAGWLTALRPAAGTTPAPAPTASFTVSPASGTAPLSVTFTDTSTGSPTSWLWDFGDGTTSTAPNPSHTYTAAGTYTVSLRATNATGFDTATRTAAVTVQEPPPAPAPTASFTVSPASGTAPLSVTFTDTSTGSPTSWLWDFGDGTTSTAQNPSHTYTAAGTYTVSLRATNATGFDTATRTAAVTVQEPPPAPAPTASFTVSPASGTAPLSVTFTDTSTGSPTSWSWDFGDGTTSTAQNPSHTYTAAGTYTVSLRATNATGFDTATRTAAVTVQEPQPPPAPTGSLLPPDPALPTVETASWPSGSGDISDDSAIYANATDPSLSVVIGDNKADSGGGIGVFDMTGALLQFREDGKIGNVDLRAGFSLGGTSVVLVGANNRSNSSQEFWVLDPTTRLLSSTKSLGTLYTQSSNYGFCLYVSPATGKFYSFVTATDGRVDQYELGSTGGEVTATRVRSFDVGGQTEGCVADDGLGYAYFGEEDVGIWRYNAEPGGGTTRTSVDKVGAGRLTADVEGLDIAYGPDKTGYLYASSQGSSKIVVYDRVTYAHIRSFSVPSNGSIDSVSVTDGLAVTGASLGPGFPHGALVVHDESNSGGTTANLKYVPLAASTTPAPAPTASFTVSPASGTAMLSVTFTDTALRPSQILNHYNGATTK
ncbi:phytase [Nocardioides gansuensis]|uniref:phytase n=1 Tax=Nocardioides gansuensis TaxID=2138300 RepID=UPI001FE32687|nr:phytase [Nocardioides gansuensis]